ncbi:MAG: amidohydrolase [Anaerolineaceae bacterium]|nr:amidohydrolase [Anaerolineaceae bacterium]
MIVDCELYLMESPFAGRTYKVPDLEEIMDEAGIDKAVLMPAITVKPDNQWLVEQIKGNPRFIPCAMHNPNLGEDTVVEFETSVRDWGIKGLKLNPTKHAFHAASKVVHPLMSKCAELDIPVSIHSEGGYAHPLVIAALAKAFPEVTIIMDHMGYRYWVADAIEAARQASNIYLATTAVLEPHFIKMAIDALGVDRIVFGSNGPITIPRIQVEVIKFLELTPEDEAKIMGGTLEKLYKICD